LRRTSVLRKHVLSAAGTFIEAGRFRFTYPSPALPRTPTVTFDAAFAILAPAGLVTGNKSSSDLSVIGPFVVLCSSEGALAFITGGVMNILTNYSATIRTSRGSFRDMGTSNVSSEGVGDAKRLY
jgi:hypothetical protein